MPKILPFRGTRFQVADLSQVVTQPYDQIDEAQATRYEQRSPHNVVRVILGKGEGRYAQADALLKQWLNEEVLVTDEKPALYPYFQTYSTPTGRRVRRGLIARVEVNKYGAGRIQRHERTLLGPKADRLKLLEATRTHIGQIFLLYSDPKRTVTGLMDSAVLGPPLLEAVDEFRNVHRIWRIDDPKIVRKIQRSLERLSAFIADGHHRYETAVEYRRRAAAGGRDRPEDFVMATLINTEDEGLTIRPTHRIISGLPEFNPVDFAKQLDRWFEVRSYPFEDPASEVWARRELIEDTRIEGLKVPTLGVVMRDAPNYAIAMLTDTGKIRTLQDRKRSEAWRHLDVNVLHDVILEHVLRITKDDLEARRFVRYSKSAESVVNAVRGSDGAQVGFLVNAVPVDQVKAVVRNGETFPQKTTDFYPKLLSGMMFYRLDNA